MKNNNNNNNNNSKNNKQIIEKKIGINYLSSEKKSGKNTGREKESLGKISSGKNLDTCKKFSLFSPTFFTYKVPQNLENKLMDL